jgi:hypothetical protein
MTKHNYYINTVSLTTFEWENRETLMVTFVFPTRERAVEDLAHSMSKILNKKHQYLHTLHVSVFDNKQHRMTMLDLLPEAQSLAAKLPPEAEPEM